MMMKCVASPTQNKHLVDFLRLHRFAEENMQTHSTRGGTQEEVADHINKHTGYWLYLTK